MANIHSDMPKNEEGHHQEYRFARNLSTFDDQKLHLWFSLNYLPGTNDVDALIWHEDVGVFVVEIKGVRLQDIEEYGLGRCVITGRDASQTPLQQALKAMHSLRNYLGSKSRALPFMIPTASFPRIHRHAWKDRWPNQRIRSLADSMLFEDDLTAGPKILVQRLLHIRDNPPVGVPGGSFRHEPAALKLFVDELTVSAKPLPTPTELERLRQIEGQVRSELRKEFPPTAKHRVTFQGYPGTGKTFRLLELGINYVQNGQDVLFICFNKVLASDIRRLLSFSQTLCKLSAKIEVADIFELLSPWGVQYGIPINEARGHDDWAALVVQAIREENPGGIPLYDAVLVDEAQDLPTWTYDFFEVFLRPDASIFVADGPGQELYRISTKWLEDFRSNSIPRRLNRNFRNTRPAFIVAQAYYKIAPDVAEIEGFIQRFKNPERKAKTEQLTLGFDRPDGLPPRLLRIDDEAIWKISEDSPAFIDQQQDVMVAEFTRILRDEYDELKADQYPIDLLVLVPDTRSSAREWAKLALERVGVPYVDYTDDNRRRDMPRREQVRFSTFHSARGIEALRVVLIGFETIIGVSERVGSPHRNLGYIVLSRALITTTVVRTSAGSPPVKFLDELIARVARL